MQKPANLYRTGFFSFPLDAVSRKLLHFDGVLLVYFFDLPVHFFFGSRTDKFARFCSTQHFESLHRPANFITSKIYSYAGSSKDFTEIFTYQKHSRLQLVCFVESENEPGAEGLKSTANFKINDLNTTALCLLHRNLRGIFDFLEINYKHYFDYCDGSIRQIQKFMSSRLETIWRGDRYWHYRKWLDDDHFIYPNVLLTSDIFLLTQQQVTEFLNKYQHYWNDFWLFQVPHHGSENNGDKLLYANIPTFTSNFINYGIGNRDAHPSKSVIYDLIATGNSSRLIPINQFSGLVFEFIL